MSTLNALRGLSVLISLLALAGCGNGWVASPAAPTASTAIAAISTTPTTSVDASAWTTEEWRTYFFNLVEQKGAAEVSEAGMWAMRQDLNPLGADFQNAWRGDIRPRLYLPVPECPPATTADAPECSYSRPVDVGHYGDTWQWILR